MAVTRVLVVEDSVADLRLIREAFAIYGFKYPVEVARDGGEALLRLTALSISRPGELRDCLVVLDMFLPKISGIQLLELIRGTPVLRQARVAILTSVVVPEEKARAEVLGIDAYLRKPSRFSEYEELVRTLSSIALGVRS